MRGETNAPNELEKRFCQQTLALEEVEAALKKEIHHRQEAEKALQNKQEQQQLLFESLLDGYALHEIIFDEEGWPIDYKFLFVNSTFETLTGLRREQILGKTVLEVLPGTEPYWIETYGEVVKTGKAVRFENYSQNLAGKWFEVSAFRPAEGQFATLFRDITERKRTEAALRESEKKYRQIVDMAEEGIWLLDKKGNTAFVNQKMSQMLKYAPEQMLGQSLFDFMDDEGKLIAQQNLERREQGISEQHDFKFRCQDGTDLWTIVTTNPIINDDGDYQGALGMLTDITDRRRAEMDLEKYTHRLELMREIDRAILEVQAPISVANGFINKLKVILPIVRASVLLIDWETNTGEVLSSFAMKESKITSGTRRPMSDFGLHEELLRGELVIREDLNTVQDPSPIMKQLKNEGIKGFIGVPLVSQGTVIGALYLSPDKPYGFSEEQREIAWEMASSLAVVIQQAKLMEQIRQQTRELEQRVADRTSELQEANERLKEVDRLKSKFVSDITHELRTPVTNMLLYLDLMRFNKPEGNEHYQQVLSEQVYRLRHLVEDSLDFSRLALVEDDTKFLPQDLNSIVAQALPDFKKKAENKGLALSYVSEGEWQKIPAVSGQLGRMVNSLLDNAINFTMLGQVQVFTMIDKLTGFAGIAVRDTGIGFTEEDKKHCFAPFYRGERVGQLNIPGNGLGLALVQRIVDLHNGRIEIESVVNEGSTITIWLPLEQ